MFYCSHPFFYMLVDTLNPKLSFQLPVSVFSSYMKSSLCLASDTYTSLHPLPHLPMGKGSLHPAQALNPHTRLPLR